MTLGVDVGGTFTDIALWVGDRLSVEKVTTTPDQSDGVLAGSMGLIDAPVGRMIHGTTVATNTLLERSGARTALVTEAGFEDLIEIGRQQRPSLYDPFADRAEPLVDRSSRIGWEPGFEIGVLDAEAVAVCFRYSFQDPSAEIEVEAQLAARGIPVSVSHRVAPEFREFERASTTVVNAYLIPRVQDYLIRLQERIVPDVARQVMVMRSSGGLMSVDQAALLPAAILLSGPAGGVVAAAAIGDALGHRHVISFDMGGTSTDVCRIDDARPELGFEREIDGLAVRMPSVAVHTVGAGGGSVGWLDPGGALRVGPRSAGAHPGPACYGRGGLEPTVTDANVALGRMAGVLAGSLDLDGDAAVRAIESLDLSMATGEVALGMVDVVESTMERAVRAVSVEQGADPRGAALVAFGGAGGLHATALARRLQMAGVIIPPFSGVFSAVGLLLAPPRTDLARSVLLSSERGLDEAVAALSAEAPVAGRVETSVDVRYVGQAHETSVPYRPGEGWTVLSNRFHDAHEQQNGFARRSDPIEAVTVRIAVTGEPALRWRDLPEHRPTGEPSRGTRPALTGAGQVDASVWWRPALEPGAEVVGPAIVEEGEATTWIGPDERATVDLSGALVVAW